MLPHDNTYKFTTFPISFQFGTEYTEYNTLKAMYFVSPETDLDAAVSPFEDGTKLGIECTVYTESTFDCPFHIPFHFVFHFPFEFSFQFIPNSMSISVAKPDQLVKRRGKLGLVALNKTFPEAVDWVKVRRNQEIAV